MSMECTAISYPYFGWMDELRRSNEIDEWIAKKKKKVMQTVQDASGGLTVSKYSIDNGFLCYKQRVVLSPTSMWRAKIIEEHHATPTTGHQGFLKTYHRIKMSFYWQGMYNDIKFVVECQPCQQNKFETLSPPGLLQPLPIPQRVWANISIDFIMRLPSCKGKTVILVVVDRLSKYAHFVPLSHPYTATEVAQLFVDHIFKLHGMPSSIVSDRDPMFISAFWKELFKLQNSKCMSSGYHPQSNGQTEVMKHILNVSWVANLKSGFNGSLGPSGASTFLTTLPSSTLPSS
ncbi:hypothetical protein ACFX14_037698 [Malus domestica]